MKKVLLTALVACIFCTSCGDNQNKNKASQNKPITDPTHYYTFEAYDRYEGICIRITSELYKTLKSTSQKVYNKGSCPNSMVLDGETVAKHADCMGIRLSDKNTVIDATLYEKIMEDGVATDISSLKPEASCDSFRSGF